MSRSGQSSAGAHPAITISVIPTRRERSFFVETVIALTPARNIFGPVRYWLVAINRRGQSFRLFRVDSAQEADQKRGRLEQELGRLDVDSWCDLYVVPGAFVSGRWPPAPN